jgi:hypothetical protein
VTSQRVWREGGRRSSRAATVTAVSAMIASPERAPRFVFALGRVYQGRALPCQSSGFHSFTLAVRANVNVSRAQRSTK